MNSNSLNIDLMKTDVSSRKDIEEVVNLFYDKVRADKEISFFFSEIVPVNWETHLPLMTDFWENVLFYTGEYEGNPLDAHRNLNRLHSTDVKHFAKWIQLFDESLDTLYKGPNVIKIKKHAKAIAKVMQQKM